MSLVASASCIDSAPQPVAESDFCAHYVGALCRGYEPCCSDEAAAEISVGVIPPSECERVLKDRCEQVLLRSDRPSRLLSVTLDFDESTAADVIARVRSAARECDVTELATSTELYVRAEEGEPCARDTDCAPGLACSGDTMEVGDCVAAPELGSSCSERCAEGLGCDNGSCVEEELEDILDTPSPGLSGEDFWCGVGLGAIGR